MKILIVDDEDLTRQGLIRSVDWDSLGISRILEANDGVLGVSVALRERPDIILCDVRMPHLDGIQMVERIRQDMPQVSAIFMSGYSDKEYLMSAIKLNAINYIEKPIDNSELVAALRKAIEQCLRQTRQNDAEMANTNAAADSLAYLLTTPPTDAAVKDEINSLCSQFYQHYSSDKFKYITTIIVKLASAPEASAELSYIYQQLRASLAPMHIHVIFTEKRLYHLVYHLYSSSPISDTMLHTACELIKKQFANYKEYNIAVGCSAAGIFNAYKSYESAVILLQSSYFFHNEEVLYHSGDNAASFSSQPDFDQIKADYSDAIEKKDSDTLSALQESLYNSCSQSLILLPNQVKSVYYDLLAMVISSSSENIMDYMDHCFSYDRLHELLVDRTSVYLSQQASSSSENKTVYLIKSYIADHYSNPSLSVKDISDYAHLSVSYLCTFFKSETGTTLNQYITYFRMDKAAQMLLDPRNTINEISSAVGYNDSNYFGKSFKKNIGLSPSEYREKVMK